MKRIPLLTLSIHAADLRFDRDRAETAFGEVQSLRANGVRTDVCWFDIEPRMGRWDEDKLRWYQGYFERARQLDLATICVLYGLPAWVRILSIVRPGAFLARWEIYCRKVETILGGSCQVVQVWNEVNHPFFQWVSSHVMPRLFQIARQCLDRRREVAVNLYDGFPGWQAYVTWLLAEAGDCIDIIGIDSFPETYRSNNARSWDPLKDLLRRVNDKGDPWYGKKPALLETGFSTYIPFVKTSNRQAEWINANFAAIVRLNESFANSLHILNWYKLFNGHGEALLNILGHFGVVSTIRKDGRVSRKQPAFDRLAERFRSLRV